MNSHKNLQKYDTVHLSDNKLIMSMQMLCDILKVLLNNLI